MEQPQPITRKFSRGHARTASASGASIADADPEAHPSLFNVDSVLREAESIMTIGESEAARTIGRPNAEVLFDQVDVHVSPKKSKSNQPIEIVVRHNTVIEQPNSDDEDDWYPTELMNEPVEQEEYDPDQACTSSSMAPPSRPSPNTSSSTLTKLPPGRPNGHCRSRSADLTAGSKKRRGWALPADNGRNRINLALIEDDQMMDDGLHRRQIVRYRLFPHRLPIAGRGLDAVDRLLEEFPAFDENAIPSAEDDDNELEIEINEEEVIAFPGFESSFGGRRTVIKRFWEARWKVTNFDTLPDWLQDNEYLRTGHRPPMPSFGTCFKSIFNVHTETGNIWTHMYGCVLFIGVASWFLSRPGTLIQMTEKIVFSFFFIGAIICMGMSFAYHTLSCHSPNVGKLFSKLDYAGISMLIVGSFIPWIYYGFYCRPQPMVIYMTMITLLGLAAMVVSLWDKFAQPKYRPLRAGVFVSMGLSSIVPAIHLFITDGLMIMFQQASLHWLLLMGALYLTGAALYATRCPERFFPGKCDLWFQSHQLFHMFVIFAAFVHFHGITEMVMKRLEQGSCAEMLLETYGTETYPSYVGKWLGLDDWVH